MRELVAAPEDFGETRVRSTALIRLGGAISQGCGARKPSGAIEGEELGGEADIVI